ncbi:MAG: histidine kinase, partial [Mycobacteriales bacterium]
MSALTHAAAGDDVRVAAQRLIAAQESAQAAIADALHDDVLQALVAARYAVDLAGQRTTDGPPDSVLAEASTAIQHAVRRTRATAWQLRPRAETPLVEALNALAARLREDSGVAVELNATALPPSPAVGTATVVYRVVQAVLRALPAGARATV